MEIRKHYVTMKITSPHRGLQRVDGTRGRTPFREPLEQDKALGAQGPSVLLVFGSFLPPHRAWRAQW